MVIAINVNPIGEICKKAEKDNFIIKNYVTPSKFKKGE